MRKPPAKSKRKKIAKCRKCGAVVETVWMMDGHTKAVEPEKVWVIFSNYANAGGRSMAVWKEHVCPE